MHTSLQGRYPVLFVAIVGATLSAQFLRAAGSQRYYHPMDSGSSAMLGFVLRGHCKTLNEWKSGRDNLSTCSIDLARCKIYNA